MGNVTQSIRWTIEKAATEFDLDRKTLTKRLRAGSIEPGEDERYGTAQIMAAVFGDLEREKIRETSARADLSELKRDQLRGKLIPIEVYRAAFEEVGVAIRQIIERCRFEDVEKDAILENLSKLADDGFAKKVAKRIAVDDESDD